MPAMQAQQAPEKEKKPRQETRTGAASGGKDGLKEKIQRLPLAAGVALMVAERVRLLGTVV